MLKGVSPFEETSTSFFSRSRIRPGRNSKPSINRIQNIQNEREKRQMFIPQLDQSRHSSSLNTWTAINDISRDPSIGFAEVNAKFWHCVCSVAEGVEA